MPTQDEVNKRMEDLKTGAMFCRDGWMEGDLAKFKSWAMEIRKTLDLAISLAKEQLWNRLEIEAKKIQEADPSFSDESTLIENNLFGPKTMTMLHRLGIIDLKMFETYCTRLEFMKIQGVGDVIYNEVNTAMQKHHLPWKGDRIERVL